jgi:hypothetical protein
MSVASLLGERAIERTNKERIQLSSYRITSQAGHCFGEYEAASAAEALLVVHRESGYDDRDVKLQGDHLTFRDEQTRRFLGDVEDWLVTEERRHWEFCD